MIFFIPKSIKTAVFSLLNNLETASIVVYFTIMVFPMISLIGLSAGFYH
jgi:hypothetical protein